MQKMKTLVVPDECWNSMKEYSKATGEKMYSVAQKAIMEFLRKNKKNMKVAEAVEG